jgi:acetyl esterase
LPKEILVLHPQARALIDGMVERGVPPTHTLTPEAARSAYLDRRALTQPDPPEVGAVCDLLADTAVGGIALRLYRPLGSSEKSPLPAMVYFHGGGWVMGDLDTHDVLCRELANASGCAVVAVDYRLGPEHRFPAAVEDAVAATRWIHANASALALDKAHFAVGGDSAGGNLAAVVAIAAREAGDLPIAFQLLIYPATDMRGGHPSRTRNGEGYVLTKKTMDYFQSHYLGSPAAARDWRASPLLCANLTGLPPALVVTAGFDPLRDEGMDYAQALTAAGNKVSYICFERQIHGFVTMGRVLDEAQSAVAVCACELRRALQP